MLEACFLIPVIVKKGGLLEEQIPESRALKGAYAGIAVDGAGGGPGFTPCYAAYHNTAMK